MLDIIGNQKARTGTNMSFTNIRKWKTIQSENVLVHKYVLKECMLHFMPRKKKKHYTRS